MKLMGIFSMTNSGMFKKANGKAVASAEPRLRYLVRRESK